MEHLNQYDILNRFQYGFRQGFSCEAQLASVVENILFATDNLDQVDLILLDFCKAFNTVPHHRLLLKLHAVIILQTKFIPGLHPGLRKECREL